MLLIAIKIAVVFVVCYNLLIFSVLDIQSILLQLLQVYCNIVVNFCDDYNLLKISVLQINENFF